MVTFQTFQSPSSLNMHCYRGLLTCSALFTCCTLLMFLFFGHNNVTDKADFSGRTSLLSVGTKSETSLTVPFSLSTLDKSWRITNRLVVEYRADIASRLTKLVSRKALADDPEVVQLAADVIDHVPVTAAIGIKRSREIVKTPQAESVEKLTNRKVGHYT